MKRLLFDNGGRPLNNDDFTILQDEIYYAVDGQFLGLPACVVAGCDVTVNGGGGYDVAAGLVYLDGAVRRFEGAAGVSLPAELFTDAFQVTETRAYQTGGSKQTLGEALVAVRAVNASNVGESVLVQPEGVLRVSKAREALFRMVGELKPLAKVVAADFDTSGRGKYGTKAFGWMKAEGNGGTADVRGRFLAAVGGAFSLGGRYGADTVTLDITNVPSHTHAMDGAGDHTHNVPTARLVKDSDLGSNRWGLDPGYLDRNYTTSRSGNHTHTIQPAGGDGSGGTVPFSIVPSSLGVQYLEWVGI